MARSTEYKVNYMPLQLPKSIFVHIPKTGGTWVRSAINSSVIGEKQEVGIVNLGVNHSNLDNIITKKKNNRYSFGFIRHPRTWLASWWRITNRRPPRHPKWAWTKGTPFEKLLRCQRDTFEDTVKKILDFNPGIVTEVYLHMLKGVTYTGRLEDYPESLIMVLALCEENFKPYKIRREPPRRVDNSDPKLCIIKDKSVRKLFNESESSLIDKFYSSPKGQILITKNICRSL